MVTLRRLWRTFCYQPVHGEPMIRFRGYGTPEDAEEIIIFSMDQYRKAHERVFGQPPIPIAKTWKIVFADASDLGGKRRAFTAENWQTVIAANPLGTDQARRIAALLAHERVHLDLWMGGDPDRDHARGEGRWTTDHDDVVRMVTDPGHPRWK